MITTNNALGAEITEALEEAETLERARPDAPSLPIGKWMKKNLFSSVTSSILSVIFAVVALFGYRLMLTFIFSETRQWDSVRTNLRLLMTQAYPDSHYMRVWISLALICALAGIALGLVKSGRGISIQRLAQTTATLGSLTVLGIIIAKPAVLRDEEGELIFNEIPVKHEASGDVLSSNIEWVRQSYSEALADRAGWWALGALLLVIAAVLWFGFGALRRRSTFVGPIPIALGLIGALVSTTWWYKWGHYGFDTEAKEVFAYPDQLVASTTRIPLTVVYAVLLGAYILGRIIKKTPLAKKMKPILGFSWLLLPFFIYWVVLRDAQVDMTKLVQQDIPWYIAFTVVGAATLWFLTKPGLGEIARIIPVVILALAAFNWIAAFFGWYPLLQKVRLSVLLLGLFGLVAPNFVGDRKQRMNLVWAWIGFITIFHFLVTLINTPSGVETPTEGFAGGLMVSLFVSAFTTIFSFPLGVLLALGRTSKMPIFRMVSTLYIEAFRGVPLITMLFFFATIVPLFLPPGMDLAKLAAVSLAFSMFSAAYLAENIRGGLQSIRRGQFEASDALGLTGGQRTAFIILPQALRVSIPPLVGQMIATYKETSLLAIVGVFDFLYVANKLIPAQNAFLGYKRESLLFISVIYWIGSFAMSKYSQRLEKQLGVGSQ